MDKIFESVKLFNTTGGQVVRSFENPEFDIPEREFRFKLIQEEINELVHDGFKRENLVEVIDACGDIVYVVVGASLSHGIPIEIRKSGFTSESFERSLNSQDGQNIVFIMQNLLVELYKTTCMSDLKDNSEFEENNARLAKIWSSIVEMCYSISNAYGVDLDGVLEEIQASNMSKFGPNLEVYRREDGKVLKGPNYFKPNIERVMREQGALIN